MKTYQFGIVGMGFAGRAQAKAIAGNPRTCLKAICTRDAAKLDRTAAEFGVECATARFPDLLSAGLDVLVPVPVGAHSHDENDIFADQLAHLVECLDTGRQPMADVVEEARTAATCLAAIESIETGRSVRVCNEF